MFVLEVLMFMCVSVRGYVFRLLDRLSVTVIKRLLLHLQRAPFYVP